MIVVTITGMRSVRVERVRSIDEKAIRNMNIPKGIPTYAHIKRELRNQIESGDLPEGARVPSEFELAALYGVSRTPTRQALRDLDMEGYIARAPGRGSFVAPQSQRKKAINWGRRTLAVACPHLECHYTRSVVAGFVERATERDFHTMVYFMRFSNEAEYEFVADVRNSGIEGMAIWVQHALDSTQNLLEKLKRASFPVVLIDHYFPNLETDFVVTDNEDMAYQLTRALIARGHRTIAFLGSDHGFVSIEERFAGYRRALTEAECSPAKCLRGVFAPEVEPPLAVVKRMLKLKRSPTAFFCINDGIAGSLLDALTELGYSVPGQIEIATVDDNRFAQAVGVPMLTAEQAGLEIGRQSADILVERISDPKLAPQQRFLAAQMSDQVRSLSRARKSKRSPEKLAR